MATLKAVRYVVPAVVKPGLIYHVGMSADAKAALTRVADRLGMKESVAAGRAYAWLAGQDPETVGAIGTMLDRGLNGDLLLRIGHGAAEQTRPRAAVTKLAEQLGLREFALTSRFFVWLARQDDLIQKWVLGLLPRGYEQQLSRLAVERAEKRGPTKRSK